MQTLTDKLLAGPKREAVAADCVKVVERHLNGLRSLRGIALRAGLAMFKTAVPDAIPRVIGRLLPDFAVALDPLYQRFGQSATGDFSAFLNQHSAEAVEALTGVIDTRAAGSSNDAVRGTYNKLRNGVRAELEALLPELGKTISSHLG